HAPSAAARRAAGWCRDAWSRSRRVGVDDVDAHPAPVGERRHEGAEGLRGAPRAADHAAEVLGVHTHLEDLAARRARRIHLHVVGVIDDPLDEVLKGGCEHDYSLSVSASAGASASVASEPAASSTAASASVTVSAVSSSPVAAAASSSAAFAGAGFSALGLSTGFFFSSATKASGASFVLTVLLAPFSPLKVPQSPVSLRSASTCSVGCAPTESQYWARSESTSMNEGSSVGWYLPISSITRPSRLVRESATTMR